MLTSNEQTRYSRHLQLKEIGFSGQQALKESSVLIIGLGGLGCPAAQYLAAAGVGTIGLCDHDLVSLSNLQRQILFTTEQVGRHKAVLAAEHLQALNPHLHIQAHTERLEEKNSASLIQGYDLVLDCSDNFPTRFLINATALAHKKPLIYGAIQRFRGQITVFAPHLTAGGSSPCLRCLVPEEPEMAPT